MDSDNIEYWKNVFKLINAQKYFGTDEKLSRYVYLQIALNEPNKVQQKKTQ